MQSRGGVLIEHLLALSLLSLFVVSLFSLLATGTLAARMADEMGLAGALASEKLEEIAGGCEDLVDVSRRPVDPLRFPGYQWETTVTPVAPGLRQVTVTITWPQRGQERQVSLTTLSRRHEER